MHLRHWMKLVPLFSRSLFRLPLAHIIYLTKQLRYENPHCHDGRLYINTFLPPIPSLAFDRLLDAVIHRKRVPFSTYFAVTDQCPYHCAHCSYGQHQPGQMNTAQALDMVRQIRGMETYFSQPCCTCLAQSLGTDMARASLSGQLPLTDPESRCSCARHRQPERLPRVYANSDDIEVRVPPTASFQTGARGHECLQVCAEQHRDTVPLG